MIVFKIISDTSEHEETKGKTYTGKKKKGSHKLFHYLWGNVFTDISKVPEPQLTIYCIHIHINDRYITLFRGANSMNGVYILATSQWALPATSYCQQSLNLFFSYHKLHISFFEHASITPWYNKWYCCSSKI